MRKCLSVQPYNHHTCSYSMNLSFLTYFRICICLWDRCVSLCIISGQCVMTVLLSLSSPLTLIDERCALSPHIHSHFTHKSSTFTPAAWWRCHSNAKMLLGRYLWAYLHRICRRFIWICVSRNVLSRDDAQLLSALAILNFFFSHK